MLTLVAKGLDLAATPIFAHFRCALVSFPFAALDKTIIREVITMRVLVFLVLMFAVAVNVMALETAAGADTVNNSQVGINAKVEAIKSINSAVINQILACQKSGKLFSSDTNTCIDVDEPLANKIAACSKNNQFYNKDTEVCQSLVIPPDNTATLTAMYSAMQAMLACQKNNQFYNSTTGSCTGGGAVTMDFVGTLDSGVCSGCGTRKSAVTTADICLLDQVNLGGYGWTWNCQLKKSGSRQWYFQVYSNNDHNAMNCVASCYNFKK